MSEQPDLQYETKQLSIRPLLISMVLAGVLGCATGFFIPPENLRSNSVILFCTYLAEIFPSILIMSRKALDPSRAEVTWAVQWAFFPVYLAIVFWSAPPWAKNVKQAITAQVRKDPGSSGKRAIIILTGILFSALCILSDLRLFGIFSVTRAWAFGEPFDSGPLNELPIMLRAPFVSSSGMVLYSWFEPLGNAFIYYMFLLFTLNFMEYVDVVE